MIHGYSLILVRVKDMEVERRFFLEAMGLQLQREIPGTVITFMIPDGPELELVPGGEIVPPVSDRIGAPVIAIFHVDDVPGFAKHLVEQGGRMVNEPFQMGSAILAYVADPEGHVIGLHSHNQTAKSRAS